MKYQNHVVRKNSIEVGTFGVHLFDRSQRLEVLGYDGNLVVVRFSANGEPHYLLKEEVVFGQEAPRVKKKKKKEKIVEQFDEDDDK